MKTFKQFFFIVCLHFFILRISVSAQSVVISCGSPSVTCAYGAPNGSNHTYFAPMSYFSSCNDGTACKFKFEVTNGKIIGGTNANPSVLESNGVSNITVRWDNVNGDGTVKVTTGVPSTPTNLGCPSCPTLTATKTIPIRYLGTPGNIKINGVAYTGSYNLGCNTTPITISVDPVDNATNYSWSLPSGWSGATNSNSITVTPNLNTQGVVKVTTSRSDVSDLVTESQLTINRPLPSISSVTPSTAPLVCSSLDVVSASASGVNADQYVWTPTGGARVNGFSTAQTVAGSVNLGATSNGSFTIQAYSSACNVASSNTKTLNIRYGPPVLGSQIFSPPYLCQSYEAPFSVNLVADVTSYDWTVSGSGAILVSGQGSSAVMAKSIYVSPEVLPKN